MFLLKSELVKPLEFLEVCRGFKEHFLLDLPDVGQGLRKKKKEVLVEKKQTHTGWVLIPFMSSDTTRVFFTKTKIHKDKILNS